MNVSDIRGYPFRIIPRTGVLFSATSAVLSIACRLTRDDPVPAIKKGAFGTPCRRPDPFGFFNRLPHNTATDSYHLSPVSHRLDFIARPIRLFFYGRFAGIDRLNASENLQAALHGADAFHLEAGYGFLVRLGIFQEGKHFFAHIFGPALAPR